MKIIGFSGSPNKDGITNTIIKKILNKTEENNHETTFFSLNDLNINPCQDCGYCKENEICDLDDDVNNLHKEIESADYIIIGSPIYYGEVSAQTKLFTDRFYSIFNSKVKNFDGKKAILVYTQGNPDPKVYEPYTEHQKNYLYNFMNFDVVNTLLAAGIRSKEDLLQKEEILKEAENIAMRINNS
jgi:multimeric flavodoxin WrbA